MRGKYIRNILILSAFFLMVCILSSGGSYKYFQKSLSFAAGLGLSLLGAVSALCFKRQKGLIFGAFLLLVSYFLLFELGFTKTTLYDLLPEGQDVKSVEIRSVNDMQLFIWDTESGRAVFRDDGRSFDIKNGDIDMEKAKSIVLRDYWLPKSVKSGTVFDMSVRFENGGSISLYGVGDGITVYIKKNGKLYTSSWLVFDDIVSILPRDIISILE